MTLQTPSYDDDRLLAYALGLEDDPELTAAIAVDPALRARLDETRRDLTRVGERLREAVPAADGDADPAAPRWERLRPYFAAPAPRRRHSRRRLAGALAAAAVLAIVVGVVVTLPQSTTTSAPSSATGGSAVLAPQTNEALGAHDEAKSGGFLAGAEADEFAVVAVARAGATQGERQSFTVVKLLKGKVATTFTMHVGAAAPAAAPGSFQVVYLRPSSTYNGASSGAQAGAIASATPSPGGLVSTPAPAVSNFYTFHGSPAVVQPLPPGADPKTFTLP